MTAREEKARNIFAKDYNCAQAVLGAFCEESDTDFALKLASGFGGGIRCGEVCGAVTGAVMAIGLKCGFYVEGDLEQKKYCNKKAFEFIEKFKAKNNSILCRDLLGIAVYSPDDLSRPELQQVCDIKCPEIVAAAVNVLEGMEF